MRHKKILFDQIKSEKKQGSSRSLSYNFSINLLYMVIKLVSIVIVTVAGSILFSALITAATQHEPYLVTLGNLVKGLINYLSWWF